jgi:hypothetical protein
MAQMSKVRGVKTSVTVRDGKTHVNYRGTDVISFDDRTITLRSNGWETVTTKTRMNQASHEYNLGYSVYQEKRIWYVWDRRSGEKTLFHDGMTFNRR